MDSGARETLRQWAISKELADRIDREFDKVFPPSPIKIDAMSTAVRFAQKEMR